MFTVAALALVAGSYFAMRHWLPASQQAVPVVDSGGIVEVSPLHEAAARGATETLKSLLESGADVNARDETNYTALMHAAENGETAAVRLLLGAGADVHLTDKRNLSAEDKARLLQDYTLEFGTEFSRQMLEDIEKLPGKTAMAKAGKEEIVHLLRKAGGDVAHVNDETRALLLGLKLDDAIAGTSQQYQTGKAPRYGKANPEKMNVPFWNAMTSSGANAYSARKKFGDTYQRNRSVVWCNQRFGKSLTFLPDGRIIEIGGEHEDFSDPDFFIYNDVFVHHGKGRFEIYGYPKAVFPPTDFHTATLVGGHIYIIGGLGYPQDRRPGFTPVYRLNCKTLTMEKVHTSGDNPGWIHDHRATYRADRGKAGEIHLEDGEVCLKSPGREDDDWAENEAVFVLDLASLKWRRQ